MRQPWIIITAVLGLIIAIGIAFWRATHLRKKVPQANFKPVANTAKVRALPEYKTALRKYHLLLIAVVLLFLTVFSSVAIIASRPVSVTVFKPEYDNRDIMLCLDISGSMNDYVKDLLDYFSKLIDEFEGQRVGLTIFNNVHLTIAPLSDDYDLLAEIFQDMKDNPNDYATTLYSAASATLPSAIGPGVVGCVNSFDKLDDSERSRAIILATDNEDAAGRFITLTQAANFAKRYNIAIYGLSTGDHRSQEEINSSTSFYESATLKEFREATLSTGGAYYAFSAWNHNSQIVVSEIVDQILEQETARYEGADTLVKNDTPIIPIVIASIAMVFFLIAIWRLSL